jgi:hypothetical protein
MKNAIAATIILSTVVIMAMICYAIQTAIERKYDIEAAYKLGRWVERYHPNGAPLLLDTYIEEE